MIWAASVAFTHHLLRRPITLSDPQCRVIALETAGFMRWIETKNGYLPRSKAIDVWIKGLLRRSGFSTADDQVKRITFAVSTLSPDVVEDFIQANDVFRRLDDAARRLESTQSELAT
jgi:hypothetical protein